MRKLLIVIVLSALAAAQEAERPVFKVYDLGPLAPAAGARFLERPDGYHAEFSVLGNTHASLTREEDWLDPARETHASMVLELLTAFAPALEITAQELNDKRQLLVGTTEAGHRILARIIGQLRAAADPPVEIDVRHLVLDGRALDDAGRAALEALARGAAEPPAALARLDRHGGRRGGTLVAPVGTWAVYRAVREIRYVPDYDVEIAQAASIADPIAAVATDGVKAAVRPFLLRDGRVLLRIVASAGDIDGEVRRVELQGREFQDTLRLRNTDLASVEQVDYDGGVVSTEAVVAPGGGCAVVLGSPAGGAARWDVLLFTVRAAPKPVGAADTFAVIPVGALTSADPARSLAWQPSGELTLAAGEARTGSAIEEALAIDSNDEGEFLVLSEVHGGTLLLRGTLEEVKAASETILALERALIRPARLDVRFAVERAGGEPAAAGGLVAPLVLGRPLALAAYRRIDTVGDYDVEIAQESRIADPNHVVVTAGYFGNALLSANPDATLRLHLDLTAAGAPDGMRAVAAQAGGVPLIQSVPLRRRVDPLRLDLAPGKPRRIELGPDPFSADEGGRLVAIVTVFTE
jgi:hypothetical protein